MTQQRIQTLIKALLILTFSSVLLHELSLLFKIFFLDAKFYRFLGWATEAKHNAFIHFMKIHGGYANLDNTILQLNAISQFIEQYSPLTTRISIILICFLTILHSIAMIGILKDRKWGYMLGAATVYIYLFPLASGTNAPGYLFNTNYLPLFNLFSDSLRLKYIVNPNHFLPHSTQGTGTQAMALCWQLIPRLYNWLLFGILITHKGLPAINLTHKNKQTLQTLRQFLLATFTLTTLNLIAKCIVLTGVWFFVIYSILIITITVNILQNKQWAYRIFCITVILTILMQAVKIIEFMFHNIRYPSLITWPFIYSLFFYAMLPILAEFLIYLLCLSLLAVVGLFKHKRWGYIFSAFASFFTPILFLYYYQTNHYPLAPVHSYTSSIIAAIYAIIISISVYCIMACHAQVPATIANKPPYQAKLKSKHTIITTAILVVVQILYWYFCY